MSGELGRLRGSRDAAELLAEGGVLAVRGGHGAGAGCVCCACRARHAQERLQTRREMVWSNTARLYLRSFEQARLERPCCCPQSSRRRRSTSACDLPELKLDHLFRMSDSTGIFQHASFTVPNFAEGYCTDDNARALVLGGDAAKAGA